MVKKILTKKQPLWQGIHLYRPAALSGIALFLFTLLIWQALRNQNAENLRAIDRAQAQTVNATVMRALDERIASMERMAARLSTHPQPSSAQWHSDAEQHVKYFADFRRIVLLRADSFILDRHPQKKEVPYPSAYFNWEAKRKAVVERALREKKSSVSGEVELQTGGRGIGIVTPILDAGSVRGFVVAVIQTPVFFSSIVVDPSYQVEVFEQNEKIFSTVSNDTRREGSRWAAESTVNAYGAKFLVRIFPIPATIHGHDNYLPSAGLLTGTIISFLFFLIMQLADTAKRHAAREQSTRIRMESLLALVPVGIFETDAVGYVTYVNKTWCRYTGLSEEEAQGDGCLRVIHPDDVARAGHEWREAIREQCAFQQRYRYVNAKTGAIHWVDGYAVPVKNAEGTVIGFLGAELDFTHQKLAEEKVQAGQLFLEAIVDNLPVALFCKDAQNDFRFTLWNKSAEKMWGASQAEMLGKTDFDLFSPAEAKSFRAKDEETIRSNHMIEVAEETTNRPGMGLIILCTKKVPVRGPDGKTKFLLGISEDITAKVLAQRQLEEQRQKMIENERMRLLGAMAGGIAHEINNPLTIIEGYAHQIRAILEDERTHNSRLVQASESISQTVERISKIIKGLKALARGGENDALELVNVGELVKETLDLCRAKFRLMDISLDTEQIDSTLQIRCRRVQISQVLLNLLNNAFDAVAGTENPRIQVKASAREKNVRIEILDSGAGIAAENLDKVMKPFFTTKGQQNGTGLGLSISSDIVGAHSGKLKIEPGALTTFVVELPKNT